jgi:hypothetical protein
MKKYLLYGLLIAGVAVVVALLCRSSKRIEVVNTGSAVIEVKTDIGKNTVSIGQNGTGYFGRDSRIQIGDAIIKVDKRVELVNTGSEIIPITYHDTAGSEQTILIGEKGTGYVNQSEPFKIGDADIRVSLVQ